MCFGYGKASKLEKKLKQRIDSIAVGEVSSTVMVHRGSKRIFCVIEVSDMAILHAEGDIFLVDGSGEVSIMFTRCWLASCVDTEEAYIAAASCASMISTSSI